MTRLERRALFGSIVGVVWAAVFFVAFFALGGVEAPSDRPFHIRTLPTAILVLGTAAYVLFYVSYRQCAEFDERDRMILIRVADLQLAAVILTVGAWSATLQSVYRDVGQMPVAYLFLVVASMLMVAFTAQSLGILFYSRHTEQLHKL